MYRDPVNRTHFYHIYNRGNSKKCIFHKAEDYTRMIAIITRHKHRLQAKIPVYCLMPNHFHLLIGGIKNTKQLAEMMRCIQVSYARYYNRTYHCSGHVFGGPYMRKDITSRDRFNIVAKYILNNPVRKGLAKTAEKWPYSGGFKW